MLTISVSLDEAAQASGVSCDPYARVVNSCRFHVEQMRFQGEDRRSFRVGLSRAGKLTLHTRMPPTETDVGSVEIRLRRPRRGQATSDTAG